MEPLEIELLIVSCHVVKRTKSGHLLEQQLVLTAEPTSGTIFSQISILSHFIGYIKSDKATLGNQNILIDFTIKIKL